MNTEICRLCGKENVALNSVFQKSYADLCQKIDVCFGVQIKREDASKKICKTCFFFTNAVYEFRLTIHDINNKLKRACPVIEELPNDISYPSQEISQNAFLNSLNLTSTSNVFTKESVSHRSIQNLKRKFPSINIPKKCYELNLDPIVKIDIPIKFAKLTEDHLEEWRLKTNHSNEDEPNLVFTRCRSVESVSKIDSNQIGDSVSSDKVDKEESSSFSSTSAPLKKKRKKNWNNVLRRKRKSNTPLNTIKNPETRSEVTESKVLFKPVTRSTGNKKSLVDVSVDFPPTVAATEQLPVTESLRNIPESVELLSKISVEYSTTNDTADNERSEDDNNLLVVVSEEVQTFICQTCNKVFDTLNALESHKKFNHKSSLRCSKCSRRFAIVEDLVRHNLNKHPEIVNENTVKDHKISNSVARKRTSAPIETKLPVKKPELPQYVISSDDDAERVPVSSKHENETSPLNEAIEIPKNDNPIILPTVCPNESLNKIENNNVDKTAENKIEPDICYIIDSDDDAKDHQSSSSNASNNTKKKEKSSDVGMSQVAISQQIVVIPSDEDKCVEEDQSSVSAKITNELNYINYIFNKCSYSDKNIVHKNKWLLKDISQYLEKTYLPIEVVTCKSDNIVVNHYPYECPRRDANVTNTPDWANIPPIDLPVTAKKLMTEINTPAIAKPYETIVNSMRNIKPKINSSLLKGPDPSNSKQNQQSEVGGFGNNPQNLIVSNPELGPKVQTGTSSVNNNPPKVVTEAGHLQSGNNINESRKLTVITNPIKMVKSQTGSNQTTVTGSNAQTIVTNSIQSIKSQNINTGTKVEEYVQAASSAVINSLSNSTIVNNQKQMVIPQGISTSTAATEVRKSGGTTLNDSPNLTINNQKQVAKSQMRSTLPIVTKVGNPITQSTNIIIPSVVVQSSSDLPQKLINTTTPNAQQNKQIPVKKHPCLQYVNTKLGEPQQGYVVMEVPTDKTESSVIVNNPDNSGIAKQPIVINGMSYPTFTKIKTVSPGHTVLIQQIAQQTNLNIQNCINICQQEIASTTSVNQQEPNVTYVVPNQNLSTRESETPKILSQTESPNTGIPDTTVITPKPMIRIKNISELTDNKKVEKNQLHTFYTTTLNEYTKNIGHYRSSTSSSNDEYIQI